MNAPLKFPSHECEKWRLHVHLYVKLCCIELIELNHETRMFLGYASTSFITFTRKYKIFSLLTTFMNLKQEKISETFFRALDWRILGLAVCIVSANSCKAYFHTKNSFFPSYALSFQLTDFARCWSVLVNNKTCKKRRPRGSAWARRICFTGRCKVFK